MKIGVVGSGYIGLTTGAAFSYLGHEVVCQDVDAGKIRRLARGDCPIFEPFLPELLQGQRERLCFTTSHAEAVTDADAVFIAVGTPGLADGSPDLGQLRQAALQIGAHLGPHYTVVVNKSTVPIGCGNWVSFILREALKSTAERRGPTEYSVVSNPEFLREGSALQDTFYPDRVVLGSDESRPLERLRELYRPILDQGFTPPVFLPRPRYLGEVPLVTTDLASAELIKYAANAFLALKISFINEMGRISEKVGADILAVAKALGFDRRIGEGFLRAGVGWGGSCFGKDTAALLATAREYGLSLKTVQAAREVNDGQRDMVVERLLGELKILKGRTVGLMGLTFKPDTDDFRDAPSLAIARRLLERGARIKVHDPVAMDRVREALPGLDLEYCLTPEDLAEDADALVLVTEWPVYRELVWDRLAARMRQPMVLDGRNFLDREVLERAGMKYLGVGR